MERFGAVLIVFGLGSGALQYIGAELRLLLWINTWGPGPAWGIRGVLVAIGVVLVVMGLKRRSSTPQSATAFGGQPGWNPGQPGFAPQGQQPGFGPQGQPGFAPQGQQPGFGPQGQPGFAAQGQQPGFGPHGQQPGGAPQGAPAQPGQPWVPLQDGTAVIPGPDGVGLQFTPKTPDSDQPPSTPFG